jgi:hypothetical protein
VAVFLLAGINAGRATALSLNWDMWSSFSLPVPLLTRIIFSTLWALSLGGLAWGLWTLRAWSRHWTLALFPVYQIYELAWHIAFVRGAYERGRLPFLAGRAALTIIVVILVLTRQRVRHRFDQDGTPEENSE